MAKGQKTAFKEVSRVEYIPSRPDTDLSLKHRKGETYTEVDFKFPFIHKKEYTEDVYIDKSFLLTEYTESKLKEYGYIIKDGTAYIRPRVNIYFNDREERNESFDDDESAMARYRSLYEMFDLKFEIQD